MNGNMQAGATMGMVAEAYRQLDKHEESLALFEKQLEFNRRVLPEDDTLIGEGCEWGDERRLFFTARSFWTDARCFC